jgi:hypothetical protein
MRVPMPHDFEHSLHFDHSPQFSWEKRREYVQWWYSLVFHPVVTLKQEDLVLLTGPIQYKSVKVSFNSGKLSVDWNGQENFSLSCELWVGTNDFNTKKIFLVRSNPRIIFLTGN